VGERLVAVELERIGRAVEVRVNVPVDELQKRLRWRA
jgi:hypothetical protein